MAPIGDLAVLGRVGVIGAGAVGSALARVLAARGARVVAVAARRPERAEAVAGLVPGAQAMPASDVPAACDLIFLAVSDDAIASLAAGIAWRVGQGVVHLSGAKSAEALAAVRASGAHPAALHPLMTFPAALRDQPIEALLERLRGTYWALEADDEGLRATLEALVTALGGHVLSLRPEDRVPYHIAAVFASNYVVALLGASATLWERLGASPETAAQALLPLLRAAVDSLATAGLPGALTGPLARGDAGTIAAHLAWLNAHGDDRALAPLRDAYLALARLALPLAEAKGTLAPSAAEALRALLGGEARR